MRSMAGSECHQGVDRHQKEGIAKPVPTSRYPSAVARRRPLVVGAFLATHARTEPEHGHKEADCQRHVHEGFTQDPLK